MAPSDDTLQMLLGVMATMRQDLAVISKKLDLFAENAKKTQDTLTGIHELNVLLLETLGELRDNVRAQAKFRVPGP